MANFILTRFVGSPRGTIDEALEDLETQLETVDDTKIIIDARVLPVVGKNFTAYALYQT